MLGILFTWKTKLTGSEHTHTHKRVKNVWRNYIFIAFRFRHASVFDAYMLKQFVYSTFGRCERVEKTRHNHKNHANKNESERKTITPFISKQMTHKNLVWICRVHTIYHYKSTCSTCTECVCVIFKSKKWIDHFMFTLLMVWQPSARPLFVLPFFLLCLRAISLFKQNGRAQFREIIFSAKKEHFHSVRDRDSKGERESVREQSAI